MNITLRRRQRVTAILAWIAVATFATVGCDEGTVITDNPPGDQDSGPPPACPNGTDNDGDGHGAGCPAGADCDDNDSDRYEGASEVCDGKDNDCDGTIDEDLGNCGANTVGAGSSPFPTDPSKDPNLKDSTGVIDDGKGDLVLGTSEVAYRYLWVANTDDLTYGTVSKVDAKSLKEVGRYFSLTCSSVPGAAGCVDANGKPITAAHKNLPSRTAVDFNMDVWVANRCRDGGQPSVTKIAADTIDCIDRNNNGKIDTSADRNGDGKITVDCNGDGKPDTLKTSCTGGGAPEFVGLDDECVLFTVNYGDMDDIGRSVCLNSGKSMVGASDAWVGTYKRPENGRGPNKFYRINGYTGKIEAEVSLPDKHHSYGCTADAHNIIWSTDVGHHMHDEPGSLTYFEALPPYHVGKLLRGPSLANKWLGRNNKYRQYGICTNADGHIWLGGLDSEWVLRFKPNRTSFDTLSTGPWTRIDLPKGFTSRGVAADLRGKVWVAIQQGYIFRIDQSIPDGHHDMSGAKENVNYWKVKGNGVIGAGVDFEGNVWGVGQGADAASRLDVDKQGNVISPPTGTTKVVPVGTNPYTYSDFTGYGLANFVRPFGQWSYLHKPCGPDEKAQWKQVSWKATTPPGTAISLRVRAGDTLTTLGDWTGEMDTSPGDISSGSKTAVTPNPSSILQVEFTFSTQDKLHTPTLHEYAVSYVCVKQVD